MSSNEQILLTSARAAAQGVTRHQLLGVGYRSVVRGVRVPHGTSVDLQLRCEAAQLIVPTGSVFSHWTAVGLLGGPVMVQLPWLQVISPSTRTRRPEVHGARRRLKEIERIVHHGFALTSPDRTFLDLAEATELPDLVALGDWLLSSHWSTDQTLSQAIVRGAGHRGVVKARAALKLLNVMAGSPMESRLRVRLVSDGFPVPVVNGDVFDELGCWIARPDLSYPLFKIAIEYERAHHLAPGQFRRDTLRDQLLAGLGWVVLRATARDLRPGSNTLTDALRALMAQRTPSRRTA
jgi:hypothetical protein